MNVSVERFKSLFGNLTSVLLMFIRFGEAIGLQAIRASLFHKLGIVRNLDNPQTCPTLPQQHDSISALSTQAVF